MPSGENSFYMDILVKDGCLGDFGEYIGRELVSVTCEEGEGIHDWYFWDTYIQHVLKWLNYTAERK